jgi:type IV pilus assembly protein PilQ
MMRLKQLLGTTLLAVATTAAAAPVSQLTGVMVNGRDQTGVVTIRANGTFTHTEYRPTDNLMLVDLAGVSIARPDTGLHTVSAPGVLSYRILGYRYSSGTEVARVELNLAPGAQAKVSEIEDGVEVRITGGTASTSAPATEAAARPAELKTVAKTSVSDPVSPSFKTAAISQTSHIRNVAVIRGKDEISVEISADGPITAKTMKLTSPDRVVLDIPNSVLEGHPREIPVNSTNIKDVRAARYQSAPPATRVVVDLVAARDFEVSSAPNKLVLKLKDMNTGGAKAPASKPQEIPSVAKNEMAANQIVGNKETIMQPAPTALATTAESKTTSTPVNSAVPVSTSPAAKSDAATNTKGTAALDVRIPVQTATAKPADPPKTPEVVFLTPTFKPKTEGETTEKPANQSRAEQAASHFSNGLAAAPASNKPPYPASASLVLDPVLANRALLQQAQTPPSSGAPPQMAGGCTTGRYTGEPFSMDVKDIDLKDFFKLIHVISGLNIVLDPAVQGTLTLAVDDIPWDQALAIVLANNGLDCQLQGNVLRIARIETMRAEAEAKHAQQDAQSLAVPRQTVTRYLSYGHAKDVVGILKKFLSARGDVVPDERSNALIIEDIPSGIAKVDAILPLLDRKTPQVEIEARVVSATRSFARDIGTQLGFGFGDGHSALGGSPSTTGINDSPIINNAGTGSLIAGTKAGTIPLFSNLPAAATSGLSFITATNNFRLDFLLSMAESRGLAKVLSRPRIMTQNNIKAVIKQGQRIPVVTGSQLGGPPSVTYIDAVLRLTVTPQITADNTIFLDIDVENTTPDFSKVNGSQLNPVLNTAQSTTQVLISDGGTVVIGGVIATSNQLAISQVPLLGSIPILGHLFRHTLVNTQTQELIFFITPKIVQT